MKVYVKKGDCQSILPGIILMMVFLLFSIGIFIVSIQLGDLEKAIEKNGIALIFSLGFFGLGVYFLVMLFAPPKKYTAKLVEKELTEYQGKTITKMTFEAIKKKNQIMDGVPREYQCYTYGSNALEVNEQYTVRIKKFNWKIKEVVMDGDSTDSQGENVATIESTSVKLIFNIIAVICLLSAALGVWGIIRYSEYLFIYILWSIASLFFAIKSFQSGIQWERENVAPKIKRKMESGPENIYSEKGNIPKTGKKIGNVILQTEICSIIPFILVGVCIAVFILKKTSPSPEEMKAVILPFLCFYLLIILIMVAHALSFINYDERKMRKLGIGKANYNNISTITKYKFVRVHNDKYFIVDEYNQLIFHIQKYGYFNNKYVLYDEERHQIAKVKKINQMTGVNYKVEPEESNTFVMKSRMLLNGYYDVEELQYTVTGDGMFRESSILNENDEEIAVINRTESGRFSEKYDVNLYGVSNDINLVLISVLTVIGNHYLRRRKRRRKR